MVEFDQKIANFSRDRLILACTELKARLDRAEAVEREPIAIVGMSCRFPGGTSDPDAYWKFLHDGGDGITEVPIDRWEADEYYDKDPEAPGKSYSRVAGHIDDVDGFDAYFFNISAREAVSLDPQYRLLLEVTWEAMEDAGINPHELRGSRTGVFVGIGADDYAKIQMRSARPESITAYTGTGNAYCYGAGRLSYFLGLHGPNYPIDTACSSSLVATHAACGSLRAGESDLCIVGGVHLILSPVGSIFLSKAKALSPTGRCRTFDAGADGFIRGEGCGMVVLKRLSEAIADGDNVHAIIRGSAINHDGPSSGFTVPNGIAQRAVIQAALKDAGVRPTDVGFVETHGTGTALGDPIEVRALAATLGRAAGRDDKSKLMLGAVKANFGHLEPASGVAGLMKAALALKHTTIPPQINFERINPDIPLDDGPFVIPTEPLAWPSGSAGRIAGVSSFGLSGTNAHVVLAEAPRRKRVSIAIDRPVHVLTLSARTQPALRALAGRYERHLATAADESLADICYTANVGRAHFPHRLAIVASKVTELEHALGNCARAQSKSAVTGRVELGDRRQIAFLFTGEGYVRPGTARTLHDAEPTFREAVAACDAHLSQTFRFSVAEVINDSIAVERLEDSSVAALSAFAVGYGLYQLWTSWGIKPSAVLGIGTGEYVAATAVGILELADALSLVAAHATATGAKVPNGWRRVTLKSKGENVCRHLAPFADRTVTLAEYAPRHMVIAAPEEILPDLKMKLSESGIRLRLEPAIVSQDGDGGAVDRLAELTARTRFGRAKVPMVSAVTGDWLGDGTDWAAHWACVASEPVSLPAAFATLKDRFNRFLELGPAPVLTSYGRQCFSDSGIWHPTLDGDEDWASMLSSLSELYVAGFPVNWRALDGACDRHKVRLPTYPFEREHYWIDLTDPDVPANLKSEKAALDDSSDRAAIRRLLHSWGDDGSQAINRMVTAPLVFFSTGRRSLFYVNVKDTSMIAISYLGSPSDFERAAEELRAYALQNGQTLVIIANGDQVNGLRNLGFLGSVVGVWQPIQDLAGFDMDDPVLRQMRSNARAYERRCAPEIMEYNVGTDSETDQRLIEIMDHWVSRKNRRAAFVSVLRGMIQSGELPSGQRVFLTYRDETIDSAILLSPIEARNGYLLDLEFYSEDMPHGCLEYSVVRIIELLKGEGSAYFSLGATYGTQLSSAPGPHEDPEIHELLSTFHREGLMNGDGNFLFKKKFKPETVPIYLCTAPGVDPASMADILLMLTSPDGVASGRNSPMDTVDPDGRTTASALTFEILAGPPVHPILGSRIPLAAGPTVYQMELTTDDTALPWLTDHRVLDTVVMPAAGFLAMGLEAADEMFPERRTTLRSVEIAEALAIDRACASTVQLSLTPNGAGCAAFGVWSAGQDGEAPDWTLNANGRLAVAEDGKGFLSDMTLSAARARPLGSVNPIRYYEEIAHFGFRYGPSFRVIEELKSGYGEALARIRLPDGLSSEDDRYRIHPVILDGCLQVQGASLLASRTGNETPGMYVPVKVGQVVVYSTPNSDLWVYSKVRGSVDGNPQQIVGDILAWDDAGNVVIQIDDLTVGKTSAQVLRKLFGSRAEAEAMFCRLEWRAGEKSAGAPRMGLRWLVLAQHSGTGQDLVGALRAAGEDVVVAAPGRELDLSDERCLVVDPAEPEHLLAAIGKAGPFDRVVHAWSADPEAEVSPANATARCAGLLHLVQALASTGASTSLWLVTRGAQPVGAESDRSDPGFAPLWGVGRTIAQEHSELWGGMIDLPHEATASDIKRLWQEMANPDGEDHIAYAQEERHVARLCQAAVAPTVSGLTFEADATYLVTGGAGALGRTVAAWMVRHGARNLVLVGRSPRNASVDALLADFGKTDVDNLRYIQADVAQVADVAALFDRVGAELPTLRGIIHTAGVLADASILEQSASTFAEVMAPKVAGAWNLHRCSAELPLDHFVLFSSTASIFGAAGQANYAAANCFLDALAHYRRARGLVAQSINWGPWDQIGMAAANARARALREGQGIRALPPQEALGLLERAILENWPQTGIISVDFRKLLSGGTGVLKRASIFRGIVIDKAAEAAQGDAVRHPLLGAFAETEGPGKRQLVTAYVIDLIEGILGGHANDLDPDESLTLHGFDSLMALEFRDAVEADLKVSLPLLTFFRDSSINGLGDFLVEELEKTLPGTAPSAADRQSPQDLLVSVDTMTESELDDALRREMSQ